MVMSQQTICEEFEDWLLTQSCLSWSTSRVIWTKKIKSFFGNLGEEKGYTSYYSCPEKKEYLTDLIWMQHRPRRFIQLSLESELSKKHKKGIIEDFVKLIDIKSYIKVGIFHLNSNQEDKIIIEMLGELSKQILTFSDELYLVIFMRYDKTDKKILFSAYDLDYKGTKFTQIRDERRTFPE